MTLIRRARSPSRGRSEDEDWEELKLDGQLQALMDAIDLARDERSIRNAIKKFTVSSGFDRYAYIHINADDVVALSDYPAEWQNLYLAKHYTIIDPVVTTAKRSMRMFAWSGTRRAQEFARGQAILFRGN
ncbi:autoinducer binding domain-containing protein [Bradyrhizobium sp. Pear76]|nr:autoinducer binding domain-containing protein [Bradyrhizobium oropedii]MCC8962923.1 autoinducer binding domain-containing protein [Bradyrhizobium oropedii]